MIKDELEYLEFSNDKSHLKLTLQGAHIFDFQVHGKEPLLFLSETARFKKGVPIRGGIPICWPWFGPHETNKNLPNHGFARIMPWTHTKTECINSGRTEISLALNSSTETLKLWPYAFELSLEIVMSDVLEVSLITHNVGTTTFELTQALHTYLKIDDVLHTSVNGLDATKYYNKVNDTYNNTQEGELHFSEEVDRVYCEVKKPLLIKGEKDSFCVETKGSSTVVIWNPGKELVQKMPDLSSYKQMLCIESSNTLADKVLLQAGQRHKLSSTLS